MINREGWSGSDNPHELGCLKNGSLSCNDTGSQCVKVPQGAILGTRQSN